MGSKGRKWEWENKKKGERRGGRGNACFRKKTGGRTGKSLWGGSPHQGGGVEKSDKNHRGGRWGKSPSDRIGVTKKA